MEAEHHHHDQQAPQRPSHHHSPEEGNYGGSPWVDMGGFGGSSQHHSPMHEYGAYGFGVSPIMPIEPSYSMSIPPPYTAHQQLQPLIMPQWPSMMAAQSPYSSSPSLPSATATTTPTTSPSTTTTATPIKCAPLPKSATAPTPATPNARRTLSDDDRRRMCQYHEDHPNVKQTEIGGALSYHILQRAVYILTRIHDCSDVRSREKVHIPSFVSRDIGALLPLSQANFISYTI